MSAERNGGFAADVAQRDGYVVVVVRGEIDMVTADAFRQALQTAADGKGRLVLDLRQTTFMDSTGLAVLLSLHRQLGAADEAIVVEEPPDHVRRLLDITGVSAIVDVQADGHLP